MWGTFNSNFNKISISFNQKSAAWRWTLSVYEWEKRFFHPFDFIK